MLVKHIQKAKMLSFRWVNCLVVVAMVLFGELARGQGAPNVQTPSAASAMGQTASAPAPKLDVNAVTPISQEVVVLREQVKVMKEYHSSLLDTVYWALGGVLTLAVLLSGAGWWSNFKLYDADKQRLKDELKRDFESLDAKLRQDAEALELRLKAELENAQTKNSATVTSIEASLALSMKEGLQVVDAKMETRVENAVSRFAAEVLEVRREIAVVRADIRSEADSRAALASSMESRINALDRYSHSIELELRQVEEKVWDTRGVHANVLITQFQAIATAARLGRPSLIRALNAAKSTIDTRYIETGTRLSADVVRNLRNKLNELGDENKELVGQINAALDQICDDDE